MTTSRTLQAEDRVAHYRVVGPLGAGGMGEVYLAQDQTLERRVALKILPPQLVRSEDRVRRFVQEAKSASSLNHPNIVTIYEIGEEAVTSGSGDVSSDTIRYISMELVSGRTLSTKIHEERTDIRTLLGYLAQAAEGIAKAHAAGIVHRDLKPGNIMVTDDGFAKVLDFGLAKLTETHGPDAGATVSTMTAAVGQTAEGTVMGTVHYMSPEQVQGKTVDQRSDVFSFGCILYEAATRQRPFSGDSNVETMHKILRERPTPVEEINAAVPNELRRLIRRCLRKSPDRRLQSMKDLALELREIADEFDELSMSATAASSGSSAAVRPVAGRRFPLAAAITIGALAIAAAVFFGMRTRGGASSEASPVARMSTETRNGHVRSATISKDGRYLAYATEETGGSAMWVHQIATGADVRVAPDAITGMGSPTFSPDGSYLFYTAVVPEAPRYRTLYRVPSLGGQPEQKGFDVDSPVAFSPDGERYAFIRYLSGDIGTVQITSGTDGDARELIRFSPPEGLQSSISWSPDGRTLAVPVWVPPPVARASVALVDVESGARRDVLERTLAYYSDVAWTVDGKDLIITGADVTLSITPQVFQGSREGGELRRVTNDLNEYSQPTVSADGVIAVIRQSARPDLYAVDPPDGGVETILRSTSVDNAPTQFGVGEDVILYVQPWRDGSRLYAQAVGDKAPRLIPTGEGTIFYLSVGGPSVYFIKLDAREGLSFWTVKLDGTGLRRVTDFPASMIRVSNDGRHLAYIRDDEPTVLWARSVESGAARRLVDNVPGRNADVVFSPDGGEVLVGLDDASGELTRTQYKIFSVEGDAPPEGVPLPDNAAAVGWIPGDDAIAYLDRADPVRNVWRLPLDGSEPSQLTVFAEGRVRSARFSMDGKSLAVLLEQEDGENVWTLDLGSSDARKVTAFTGTSVFWWRWLGNSSRIVVAAGDRTRDVVLIRDVD